MIKSIRRAHDLNVYHVLGLYIFRITTTIFRGQWVKNKKAGEIRYLTIDRDSLKHNSSMYEKDVFLMW